MFPGFFRDGPLKAEVWKSPVFVYGNKSTKRNEGYLFRQPTYINGDVDTNKLAAKFLEKQDADFKCQFDAASYEKFFEDMGYCCYKYS